MSSEAVAESGRMLAAPAPTHALHQGVAPALWQRQAQVEEEVLLVRWHGVDGPPFFVGGWHDVVVVAVDDHIAVAVAHRGEQLNEAPCRIRDPVAVVPRVEPAHRAEHGDLHVRDPTDAEDDLWHPGLVDRAVADQPEVRTELRPVFGEVVGELRASHLLLPFEEEDEVHGRRDPGTFEGVHCGQSGLDRCLVIGRGSPVDAPLGVERIPAVRAQHFAVNGDDRRLERRRAPLLGIDGLAVVVCVDTDRRSCLVHDSMTDDHRRNAWFRGHGRREPPDTKAVRDVVRHGRYIGEIRRYVRKPE